MPYATRLYSSGTAVKCCCCCCCCVWQTAANGNGGGMLVSLLVAAVLLYCCVASYHIGAVCLPGSLWHLELRCTRHMHMCVQGSCEKRRRLLLFWEVLRTRKYLLYVAVCVVCVLCFFSLLTFTQRQQQQPSSDYNYQCTACCVDS